MSRFLLIAVLTLGELHTCFTGCGGTVNLPIKLGEPSTHVRVGQKSYTEKTVHALATHLVSDIPGLSMDYARVIAEDALHLEENYIITYRFFVSSGTARISQFKIDSTTLLDHNVNINWNILQAKVSYTAETEITVHARRRRRWIGGGRRRCSKEKRSRGVTTADIAKIESKLTSVMNRIGSKTSIFVLRRVTSSRQAKSSRGTCSAWKRSLKLDLQRTCAKRSGKVPTPYSIPPTTKKTLRRLPILPIRPVGPLRPDFKRPDREERTKEGPNREPEH